MASNTSIPIIVQGNSFSLAIPLQIYVIDDNEMVLQDYSPDPTDKVTIQLKGSRRNYTYTPTIDDNIANIDLGGYELADNYAVVVSIVKQDGKRLRSFRTDQFFIVESSDDLTQDDIIAGLEENVIYLNAQAFIAGADGRGIVSIVQTSTSGLVNTYTITYTDNTTSTIQITNGEQGVGITSIAKTSTSGLVDTYTITLSNGTTSTFEVTNGRDGYDLGLVEIADNLTTNDSTKVLSAKQGKVLNETFKKIYDNLLLNATFSNQYLTYSNGVIGVTDYAHGYLAKMPVEPDTCYYINRSTSWSTNANNTNYVALMDGEGAMSLVLNEDGNDGDIKLNRLSPNGGVIKTRSNTEYLLIQLGRAAARPKNLVENEYVLKTNKVVLPSEYYDVQNNVRLNDSVYPYGCKRALKVLLIGSSYGVNSIMALPPLAASAGIDIVVGNLYQGSVTMAQIASRMNNTDTWAAYGYFDKIGLLYRGDPTANPRVTKNTTYKALQDESWDVVIIQRSAAESPTEWTAANTASALTIIDYITANCSSHPKILLNSSFAYPISQFTNRAAQQAATDAIIAAAKTARSELGIDIINVARALQLCRDDATINDSADLTNGTVHLNSGIGMYITACCMFEALFGIYGVSVRTQTHIHTAAELKPIYGPVASTQYPIMGDNISTKFAAPTEVQATVIRKYAQISVRDV